MSSQKMVGNGRNRKEAARKGRPGGKKRGPGGGQVFLFLMFAIRDNMENLLSVRANKHNKCTLYFIFRFLMVRLSRKILEIMVF